MKALTVQQPWAWAIFHGKTVENRTQLWSYRGPLAIHAGNRWSESGERSPLIDEASRGRSLEHVNTRGAIIGVVDLVDVHESAPFCCGSEWGETWDVHHLVLANPRPIPLREQPKCRGALGLWMPPADIVEQLQAVTHA